MSISITVYLVVLSIYYQQLDILRISYSLSNDSHLGYSIHRFRFRCELL